MSDYDFHDRASYIAASTMWKADYKELTAEIRAAKLAYKEAARVFSKTDTGKYYEMSEVDRKAYFAASSILDHARSDRAELREKATKMIDQRHQMKIDAQEQYEEQKSIA